MGTTCQMVAGKRVGAGPRKASWEDLGGEDFGGGVDQPDGLEILEVGADLRGE